MLKKPTYEALEQRVCELEAAQSDHKLLENELRESKQLIESIIRSTEDVIVFKDMNYIFRIVNPAMCKLACKSENELVGKTDFDIFPPKLAQKYRDDDKRIIEGGQPGVFEEEIFTPEGIRFVHTTKAPVLNKNNESQGIIVIVRDITERTRAEELLKESEKKYRSVVENASEIITVAQEGAFKFVNPKASEISGYSEAELMSTPFIEIVHPDDRQMVMQRHVERLNAQKSTGTYELRILTKAGAIKWLESRADIINWEGKTATLNMFTDITDRKHTLAALKKSEERFRKLVTTAPHGIQLTDLEGKIVYSNPAHHKIQDYSDGELVGKYIWDLMVDDTHRGEAKSYYQKIVKEHTDPEVYFSRNRTKDDRKIDVQINWNYIYDTDGKVESIISIISDITEIKKAEKIIKDSQKKYQSLSKMLRMMCDNVTDMIWVKDFDKKFIFANQAICKGLLNAADTSEPIGKTDLFFAERERKHQPDNPNYHTFGELCQDSDAITLEKGKPQQFDEFGTVKGEYLFLDVRKTPFIDETGKTIGVVGSARDVTKEKMIEEKMKRWNEALEEKIKERTTSLEDLNTALKVLLNKRNQDAQDIEEKIFCNYELMIFPFFDKLKNSDLTKNQLTLIEILETTLKEIISPFSKKLSDPMVQLTPREIQIASFIKQGVTTKEIAQTLNCSDRTIHGHRDNIRIKLKIKNKKINLRTFLLNL